MQWVLPLLHSLQCSPIRNQAVYLVQNCTFVLDN